VPAAVTGEYGTARHVNGKLSSAGEAHSRRRQVELEVERRSSWGRKHTAAVSELSSASEAHSRRRQVELEVEMGTDGDRVGDTNTQRQ
jgi:hypothetical protein